MSVEISQMPKKEAESFAKQFPSLAVELYFQGTTSFFGRGNARFNISETGEGCACSMLTDDADWNAEFWDLQSALLPHTANLLSLLNERVPNGFIFEALWADDRPTETLTVSFDELRNLVLKNQIKTKAKYVVENNVSNS
jgi:hypothetical protein